MFRFLVRVSKTGACAHVWTGQDTACKMWRSGGLKPNGVRLSSTQLGRRLCGLCAAESGVKCEPGSAPKDLNAALHDLEKPEGSGYNSRKAADWSTRARPPQLRAPQSSRDCVEVAPLMVDGVSVQSDAFLQTYAWRRLRMATLRRYGPKCMCCGATPATGAVMNVDHIKPRRLFPHLALDENNLQVLCHECNHGKGNWDHTDWRPEDEVTPEVAAFIRAIAAER